MESNPYMSCELEVNTKSKGWQKTITKLLENIKEVSYTIDAQAGIAYISGRIDPNDLLNKMAKAGKHAKLVRIDAGYHLYGARSPLVNGNGYGNYPHNSYYELPPPPQPSQHISYEPSAPYMPPPQQPGEPVVLYDSDIKCSIM
ncbi:hypothetical protein UlMin_003774 [Ulmus minor]